MGSELQYEYGVFRRVPGEDWSIVGRPYDVKEVAEAFIKFCEEPDEEHEYPLEPGTEHKVRKRAVAGWEDLD